MAVAEKMVKVRDELLSGARVLSHNISAKESQKAIQLYQYFMTNLQRNLLTLAQGLDRSDGTDKLWDYVQNVTTLSIRYQLLVLQELDRFLRKTRQYMDLTMMSVDTETQKEYSLLYRDIGRIHLRIQKHNKVINELNWLVERQLMPEEFAGGQKFYSYIIIRKKLLDNMGKIKTLAKFCANQVPQHLVDVRYIIDRVQALVPAS